MKSCFFIGHRDTPDSLLPLLSQAVEKRIIENGVMWFVVGNYGSFDRLAAHAVLDAKKKYPGITLSLLLPYNPAERRIRLPDGFDDSYYPPGMEQVPRRLSIVRANRYMVDHVDYLIAYACYPASNATSLLQYAEKRAKQGLLQIENFAVQMDL